MTKADLVDKIHAKAGLGTKAATEQFLDAAINPGNQCAVRNHRQRRTGFLHRLR